MMVVVCDEWCVGVCLFVVVGVCCGVCDCVLF